MHSAIQLHSNLKPVGFNSSPGSEQDNKSSLRKEDVYKSSRRRDDVDSATRPASTPGDEVYRGQTINYNTLHNRYSCHMDFNGSVKKCSSATLKGIKRAIDSFKKKTDGFTPFMIIKACYLDLSVEFVVDRRIDGKYVTKLHPTNPIKETVDFEEKLNSHTNYFLKYFFYNPDIMDKYQALCKKEDAFIKKIREEKRECLSQLTQITENP